MSKIFDALKKVQADVGAKGPLPTLPDEPMNPEGLSTLNVPETFIAELASMKYAVDAKVSRAHKAIAFACSVYGEGASTVSRIFAQVLVQDPALNVVLVDANTHDPTVHSAFDLEMGVGLTDAVLGKGTLQECTRATSVHRLSIVSSGAPVAAPMRVFASERMRKIITDLLAAYDYVIFDAPPVLLCPETTVLSSQIDGIVFVVEAVRTKREVVQKAVESIGKAGGHVLGLVLNKNKHFIPEFIYKRV